VFGACNARHGVDVGAAQADWSALGAKIAKAEAALAG
jgi:hypothetical protein